jgi:4-carboxymuconolactone decarboxylase
MPATGKESRFPQLSLDQLDDQQKPLGEQVMKVSSIGIAGPYNPLLRSPVLGQRLLDLFHYLRWETSVPIPLNEFAILIIARQWRSQVEWYAHAPLAAKAGLSLDIIAELKTGKRPSQMAEDEAVVYDFVGELTTAHAVSDQTYARAKKLFSDQQIVDLTAVAGNYVMVAMLLAMAEATVPPGKEPPFKVGGVGRGMLRFTSPEGRSIGRLRRPFLDKNAEAKLRLRRVSDPGEGLRSIDRPEPLTPTLSHKGPQGEREFTAVAETSDNKFVDKIMECAAANFMLSSSHPCRCGRDE